MSINAKVSAIRFKGFTEAWEQRKLGECFDERQERSATGELISVTINDGIRKFDELGRHDNSSDDKSHYKRVEIGDIAYNSMRMWQGASGYSPYSGILSPAYTVITPKDGVDSVFFSYAFKRPQMIHSFQLRSQGITSDTWNLKYPAFSKIDTMLPTLSEQVKIGEYFQGIDNIITLHRRKLLKLKNVKKAMLEKMFPKNESNVPEIRFTGFTDAWEQRKLGDYARFRRGSFPQPYGNKEWYDGEGAMPFVQVVDITDRLELVDNTKQKISKVAQQMSVFVPKGKVLVTLQGSIGRVAITQYETFVDRTILIFEEFNEITDKYFWSYTIQQKFDIEKQIAPGGTIKTITKEALSSFTIFIPKIEEQKRIGTFFQNLDNLITLHQRKYEKLQNIKKACLERMFV